MYLEMINILLPLRRIDKSKLRFSKPWITLGLQKSISVKNKLFTKLVNTKDPILKEQTHIKYKNDRKLLSTLMKKVSRLIIINILRQIGTILRIHGKESNP